MGKKRIASCKKIEKRNNCILNPRLSKKAQITIFMIVGVIILFTFIFLFQLVNSAQKNKLVSEQEKVFTKAFKKEAMRIYVEDCLSDELEEALIMVGQQGRVWSGQPGGIKEFSADINGVENPPGSGNRLSYGLARTQNLQYDNSYPCHNKTNSSPEFCQYKFPENNEGFGELDLKTSTIRNDLRRYLINRTVDCIINYTKTNISNKADVEIDDLSLRLNIENDGININAEFPLKFSLGGEEFFHLSQFDFFYPTQFKWLLEAAAVRPLFYDWRYLDFNYTEGTLEQQNFDYASNSPDCINGTCTGTLFYDKYSTLGITMQKEENENGDDIFTFLSPQVINRPEPYEFKVARQNRPPALDYINRSQCLSAEYDYLVIPDDEELGDINITLFALDPDEDNVTLGYKFECDDHIFTGNMEAPSQFEEGNHFNRTIEQLPGSPPLYCILTSIAVDEHKEADWQETRILIDRPITLNISLQLPYPNVSSQFMDFYYVSREDPIYVNITWPQDSLTVEIEDTHVNLIYTSPEGLENFIEDVPSLATIQGESCINFPWTNDRKCDINDYEQDFVGWETYFDRPLSHFKELTENGVLNLSFTADYCSDLTKEESISANIVVKECVPYINPERPYAYNAIGKYHQYVFGVTEDGKTNLSEFGGILPNPYNPFLATHSCCAGDLETPGNWKLKGTEEVCFINPEPGCYGNIVGYSTTPNSKYILEEQIRYCDGKRGNTCDGKINNQLWDGKLVCGDIDGCDGDSICQGENAWGIVEWSNGKDGICHGEMGCEKYDQDIILVTDAVLTSNNYYNINQKAKIKAISDPTHGFIDDSVAQLYTSCSGKDGLPCDINLDLFFNGICDSGAGGCCNNILTPSVTELDAVCDTGCADCSDPGCHNQPCDDGCTCIGTTKKETECLDGIDNDGDGDTDCSDDDCLNFYDEDCTNGIDDDCDGLIDWNKDLTLADPDCIFECNDGEDNDNPPDGLWDSFEAFDYEYVASGALTVGLSLGSHNWPNTPVGHFTQTFDYISGCKIGTKEEQAHCAQNIPNSIIYSYGPSSSNYHSIKLNSGEEYEIDYDFPGFIEGKIRIKLEATSSNCPTLPYDCNSCSIQDKPGICYDLDLKGDHSDPECTSTFDNDESS
jgi:hypothetical protein